jgi:DNA-binding response OmpR family regulator
MGEAKTWRHRLNSAFDLPEVPSTDGVDNNLEREDVTARSAQESFHQRKILIVEDEPELAALLEHFLRNKDFVTATAGDGLTACRMINALRPDLILLDIKLPELDGWEVCRLVRKIPDNDLASTPIMMLSALATNRDRDQGLKLGADDYITKPYSLKEIVLKANNLIDRHQANNKKERSPTSPPSAR